MMNYKSTREVAALLGVRSATLAHAVWDNRLPAPPKNSAGDFCWRAVDVQRAKKVFPPRTPKAKRSANRNPAAAHQPAVA